ncbi:hypothetical protein [Streptococcus hillyeri]|uniref:Uncharacterized protein n=1 Tax=Streptococcus hillyeri TaxID=2282420 RepID=A0A3L9DSV7_9STRE|nr:hypothetical protein [Streptococcus hillyeri]RLY02212.1 hypothetical protein EAF07_08160 [Streptococcus hillyeri]
MAKPTQIIIQEAMAERIRFLEDELYNRAYKDIEKLEVEVDRLKVRCLDLQLENADYSGEGDIVKLKSEIVDTKAIEGKHIKFDESFFKFLINASANDILIEAEKIRLKGKSLVDTIEGFFAKFDKIVVWDDMCRTAIARAKSENRRPHRKWRAKQ